jgi:glycosyltransferase involved in cell wall biosynthesis
MIKVLFLSAWYPNRYDAMAGLFVRKHAEAVSLYCDVKVLYVHGDKNISTFEIIRQKNNNVYETIVYYPEKNGKFLRKVLKAFSYFRAVYIGYHDIKEKTGFPDIIHVNVLTRTGILAYWLKKRYKIPYVITEHWTRYLQTNDSYKGLIRKILTQKILKHSSAVMPVSELLKASMLKNNLLHPNYYVINNVVDSNFFNEIEYVGHNKKRILHVSCFLEKAKNVKGLLRAIKSISLIRDDFEVIILGSGIDYETVIEYYKTLDFPDGIINFLGEKTSQEVAEWYAKSDFSVLFSNYETAGIVISESLASGKPVISTKVGIAPDYISKEAGILVEIHDEKAMTDAMNYMLDHFFEYDRKKIKQVGSAFSYNQVGSEIYKIYQNTLDKSI